MTDTVKIVCENTSKSLFVNQGTSLLEISEMLSFRQDEPTPILAAYVNNRLKELSYRVFTPLTVRFINITHFEGIRVYQRTLFFILDKAVHDLFADHKLYIKHAVSKGIYCEIDGMEDITEQQVGQIKERMQAIVRQNIPIVREKIRREEALQICRERNLQDKITLLNTRPRLYVTIYNMADVVGYFFGGMAISTGYITNFDLHKYYRGFRVALPRRTEPEQLEAEEPQNKLFEVFNDYAHWMNILGVGTLGSLNAKILARQGGELIRMAEAVQEKVIGFIADQLYARHKKGGARIVLISGPSSSGKTTTARRFGIQLQIMGMQPVMISLDDYFVEREHTPHDENGEYDYEALEAIDVGLFNQHLEQLFAGEEVEIPRYNFISGKRELSGRKLRLTERSVLVVEGIHGLNPNLVPNVDPNLKFKIYVSALTSIAIDNLNRVSTTDNRLIRRIVRDYYSRGNDATETLRRWESVRRGEDKHIFPNQEQADMMFNSSLFYELAVLTEIVRPLLREVPDTVPEFGEAIRLLKFIDHFTPLGSSEVPPTSILREFIGGGCFEY